MRGMSKSTDLGTIGGLVLAPREMYPRELADATLPLNWTRCRIGMFFSLVGLAADDNTAPPTLDTVPYSTAKDRLIFGIGNGVGTLGDPGNRFVGLASPPAQLTLGYMESPAIWYPMASAPGAVIGNGASISATAFSDQFAASAKHQTPAGTANFAAYWGLDIQLTTTGVNLIAHVDNLTPAGVSDVSAASLLGKMITPMLTRSRTQTGGWWASAPVNMRHVMIRLPYYNTRLRIHRLRVLNLG